MIKMNVRNIEMLHWNNKQKHAIVILSKCDYKLIQFSHHFEAI